MSEQRPASDPQQLEHFADLEFGRPFENLTAENNFKYLLRATGRAVGRIELAVIKIKDILAISRILYRETQWTPALFAGISFYNN
jgi:hypothetical protein